VVRAAYYPPGVRVSHLDFDASYLLAADSDAWDYYRELTIDNTGGAAKSNWPVLVNLTGVSGDGTDLQFRATDGTTVLDHWVESFPTAVWVKVPSIGTNTTATVRVYYDNPAAIDASDVEAVFLIGEDFRTDASIANIGGGTVARSGRPTLGNAAAYPNPIALHGGTGWRQTQVREQSNIVWTGTEWVFLVSGMATGGTVNVGLWYTTDLAGTWTEYASNSVLPLAEDPYICVTDSGDLYTDGSGWRYVMFERKTVNSADSQNDIGVARTKNFRTDWEVWDGSAWTATVANHAAVLVRGSAATWEDHFTGSPTVLHDGTGFVCVYEGAESSSGPYHTGVARSSDCITWTKEATNPILATDVPDDMVKLGSTWWLTLHDTGGGQFRASTTDDPANWDSSSFTLDPAAFYEAAGNSVNLVFGPDGDRFATYQDGIGTSGINLFNWIGGAGKWTGQRYPSTTSDYDADNNLIDANGSELILRPLNARSRQQLAVWTVDTPLTSGFEVVFRRKTVAQADDQFSYIAVGSGAVSIGANLFATFANGYVVGTLNAAEASVGTQIRKYTSSSYVTGTNVTGISATLHNNYNRHQYRVTAAGAHSYLVAGSSVVTYTSTDHLSASKSLMLWQGHDPSGSRGGGTSHYEWVFARPYDGVDPSVSLGSEEAA